MSYLTIKNLHKSYGTNAIFHDIHFNVEKGKFLTLLGPSGCGKSTLLRCIAGLTSVSSGKICLNGQDITVLPPQKRHIGMVFQSYALFPNMTVKDNVAFGLKMQKLSHVETKKRVKNILELVELGAFAERYPAQLSGGQCQRVALARSLVTHPQLLLLDEPLSALDARIRKHLREQIRTIQQELNLTTIFVTHDQEEALTMSDKIVLMNKGNIVQRGNAESIYMQPADTFVATFIGSYNLLSPEKMRMITGQQFNNNVAIRPESIEICSVNEGIRGVIKSVSLLGNIVRYSVLLNDIEIVVDSLNRTLSDLHLVNSEIGIRFNDTELKEVA